MEPCRFGVLYLVPFLLWGTAILKGCSGDSGDGSGMIPFITDTVSSRASTLPTPEVSSTTVQPKFSFVTSFYIPTSTRETILPTNGSAIIPSSSGPSSRLATDTPSPSVKPIPSLTPSASSLPVTTLVTSSSPSPSPSSTQSLIFSPLPPPAGGPSPTPATQSRATSSLPPQPTTGQPQHLSPSPSQATSQPSPTQSLSVSSMALTQTPVQPSPTPALPETTSDAISSISRSSDTHTPFPSTISQPSTTSPTTSLQTTPTNTTTQSNNPETTPTTRVINPQATPTSSPNPQSGGESVLDKIASFFMNDLQNRPELLLAVILGPVVIVLLVVVICIVCCCVHFTRKKNRGRFDLRSSQASANRNGGINSTYRPRSRASVQEMKHCEADAFYSDFTYQTASQPYHSTMAASSDAFLDPLPSISPLSYPSQLRNYIGSPDRRDHPSSPTPRISLNESPNRIRKYPGSSPSLNRPTPLGQQLKRQAERNSTQGSRNSIQGSRASISAMGSRTSFSNSFLSSNNTMSRDEMRSSGFLASNKTMSEGETSSQTSCRPLMRQTSLDMVPTRESPVQPQPGQPAGKMREYKSLTCITNPVALEAEGETEAREEGDGVDENDLRKDPLMPIMTSAPVSRGAEDLPTKEARQKKVEGSWKATESGNLSAFTSTRKKNLRQLTSLTLSEAEERETDEHTQEAAQTSAKGAEGEKDKSEAQKDEKAPAKPMSRLEKLTSLTYIRSSIRRSLKKKRVSFLRTPESTPKAKKKTPPRTLPAAEPDLDPDPLTFSNPDTLDAEGPMLSPRIHTPSPLSPEFEGVDEYPQRYPDDFFNPDIYPETHTLRYPYPGVSGGGRTRAYSELPMFAQQLSQPTYYPSSMHYPQPSYPQLSQQYIPPSYGPPQPLVGSPSHRSFGPLSAAPTLQQPLVGSPPHHNLGPFSFPPQPLVGSPPHHGAGPLSMPPQPLVGSPSHYSAGPLSFPPQPLVGSPSHYSAGPLSFPPQPLVGSPSHYSAGPLSFPPQPLVGSPPHHHSLGPLSIRPSLHPMEPHGRRYTDSGVSSRSRGRGGGGGNERFSGDPRRQNRAQSPDVLTDTESNFLSRYDHGTSPDRYTETSTPSDLAAPSPDVYTGLMQGRDGYLDKPLRYRGTPTSPEEQHAYPHQFYSMQGGLHPYAAGGEKSFRGHPPAPQYSERCIDGPQVGPGGYRQGGLDSQVQSPAHQPYQQQHRRASVDHHQGHSRQGSSDTPSHSRHGSTDTPSHSRHGSTDTPSHSRQGSTDANNRSRRSSHDSTSHTQQGSSDANNRSRRNSSEMTGRSRRGSTDATPNHSRQGSRDASGAHDPRGSAENQHLPLACHTRRSSNQPAKARRSSIDSHPARHGPVGGSEGRRRSVESHPRPRYRTGFHPILEPGPQRNGMGVEEAWQHSQIDEELVQYGMGSQHGRMGWGDDDATPTEHGNMQRAVDSSTNGTKAKVSWNNEIIEHLRTPSDSSERYDL